MKKAKRTSISRTKGKKTKTRGKTREERTSIRTTKTTTAKTKEIRKKARTKEKSRKTKARAKEKARRKRIPKGFDLVPGQATALDKIKARLEDTAKALEGLELECRVYTHEYDNGEIDGEIAVPVPRGRTAIDIDQELETAFQNLPLGLGSEFWYALGVRLSIHKDEAEDRSGSARVRGMDDLMMYYRRVNTPNLIDSFLREQKIMIPGVEEKYGRKVEIVYLRLHWNPSNEKPSR